MVTVAHLSSKKASHNTTSQMMLGHYKVDLSGKKRLFHKLPLYSLSRILRLAASNFSLQSANSASNLLSSRAFSSNNSTKRSLSGQRTKVVAEVCMPQNLHSNGLVRFLNQTINLQRALAKGEPILCLNVFERNEFFLLKCEKVAH